MTALTVIVVNWNTQALLRRCLWSAQAAIAEVLPDDAQILVVDNASTDGSAAMVAAEFPDVDLLACATNLGFAAANNRAIQASKSQWLLLLNSDAEIGGDALRRLVECGAQQQRAAIVGCRLGNPDGSFPAAGNAFPSPASTIGEAWGIMPWLTQNPYYPSDPPWRASASGVRDWIGGACLLVRRAAIDEVGLLDERFFMNAEEMDWCYRMAQRGWQAWYVADAAVVHVGGASADRRTARQRMRLYEGKCRFVEKHYGRMAGGIVRLNFRVASLVKAGAYSLAYLVTRRECLSVLAASHWPAAWTRKWA
ncbi:MAG: glycosyltransferase family 2 protein [Caldilineaceae bacterium]|nr:glycosyltransferase family 2 protein [Caldilineaceae bacterium]